MSNVPSFSNDLHRSGRGVNDIEDDVVKDELDVDVERATMMDDTSIVESTVGNATPKRLTAKPHAFSGVVLSPKHARDLNPTLCMAITSSLAEQNHNKDTVPYTSWITEAWRVLCWAEPSAALFWELATMYHTLQMAGRDWEANVGPNNNCGMIPPILSCGSTGSMTSGATSNNAERSSIMDKKKFSAAVSAKELPVWLVGTFLLLHCEEFACQRSLSGEDERRWQSTVDTAPAGGRMDFNSLFRNQSLSPRTRLHAGWNNDNTHCAAFLLRHLRKILVLSAVPHNADALVACMSLAALPIKGALLSSSSSQSSSRLRVNTTNKQYSANDIRRQHDAEHESVGLQVRLSMEDLERLDLTFQPPSGGGIDDPPMKLGEFLWQSMYQDPPPPMASIPLGDVERELRQHLELELSMTSKDGSVVSTSDEEDKTANALARMTLMEQTEKGEEDKAKQPIDQFLKELSYTRLRGTTILFKPNLPDLPSGASVNSIEQNFSNMPGRLHDLLISDCTDAHFYLLMPFEHVTIAACAGCTIVVGAVAGLLHIVDCQKSTITSSARRIIVSNSCDAQLCVFTPSQPLLLGDNRTCQFAPYNTYYDGLREDLLATGLAAAVFPENYSRSEHDIGPWPPLQCANNKWRQPIDVSKLEVPQVPGTVPGSPSASVSPLPPGADEKAMGTNGNDVTMQSPVLVPPTDFQVLFVPLDHEPLKQSKNENEEDSVVTEREDSCGIGSQYCKHLAEVLHLSPFRLPLEYERTVLLKTERMKNIQQAVQKNLNAEQQKRFEEELNRGFRDWLVTSGNLRQVLDLVHLDRKNTQT